jgi:hypothetical protein
MNHLPSRVDGTIRFLLCVAAAVCMPSIAHAYLDPGTGSLIFQSLLALLFGVGVAWRKVRETVAGIWRRVFSRKHDDDRP